MTAAIVFVLYRFETDSLMYVYVIYTYSTVQVFPNPVHGRGVMFARGVPAHLLYT